MIRSICMLVVLDTVSAQSMGSNDCPCIGTGSDYGVNGALKPIIAGKQYDYGTKYGMATCAAHDAGRGPFCEGEGSPAWCADSWCYVDPKNCKTGLPPGQSKYFTELFFSYQTCGTQNTFTEWFGSSGASAHKLPELATVATTYVKSIVRSLESNEAELRGTSSARCSYDSACPCHGCNPAEGWGSTPLTFQQTLAKPLKNGDMPGVDACLGDIVADTFQRIASSEASSSRVGFEYYGSTRGTYMQWPGMEDCSTSYDPRFRDWFAGAAAGPKDVVIVIDTSGSMSGDRMKLAKSAASAVVDTLTDADFATVIDFDSNAKKMSKTLLKATSEARETMRKFINDDMDADGGTNFRGAFEAAEEVLSASTASSGCNRVILFLSDGSASWWDGLSKKLKASFDKLGGVHVITYALGSGADSSTLKKIACGLDGILYKVADNANLGDIMSEYYKLLSPMMEPCQARWISYKDVYTKSDLLGVCMAAYAKQSAGSEDSCTVKFGDAGSGDPSELSYWLVPELIGVACVDMSLIASDAELRKNSGWADFEARVKEERALCPKRVLTEGQLEVLRARVSRNSICSTSEIPSGALTERTYSATGDKRSESKNLGIGMGGVSPGGQAGIAIGAIIFLGAGFWARKKGYFKRKRGGKKNVSLSRNKEVAEEASDKAVEPKTIQVNVVVNQPAPQPVAFMGMPTVFPQAASSGQMGGVQMGQSSAWPSASELPNAWPSASKLARASRGAEEDQEENSSEGRGRPRGPP